MGSHDKKVLLNAKGECFIAMEHHILLSNVKSVTLFCQNACKNIIFVLPWPQCLFHFEVGQRFAVPLKDNGVVHVRFARVLKLQF